MNVLHTSAYRHKEPQGFLDPKEPLTPLDINGRIVNRYCRPSTKPLPLRLRDVEAFLLLPDAFPDRLMLPRLAGLVHQSQVYPLSAFSPEAWQSEERERYLAELGKDVGAAQEQLKRLGGGGP